MALASVSGISEYSPGFGSAVAAHGRGMRAWQTHSVEWKSHPNAAAK